MRSALLGRIGFGTLALIAVLGAYVALWNPVRAQRNVYLSTLDQVTPPAMDEGDERNVDFAAMRTALNAKPGLWDSLIPPPQTVAPPPDLAAILKDVIAKRAQMGSGSDLRVLIVQPDNPRGEYLRVGESVRGCVIKEILGDGVIFSQQHLGVEYTIQLPRQR
ncbi:MAG: hypothetical protein AMXMBFR84_38660 [Candidatus Hydrogenedentota bacterium]